MQMILLVTITTIPTRLYMVFIIYYSYNIVYLYALSLNKITSRLHRYNTRNKYNYNNIFSKNLKNTITFIYTNFHVSRKSFMIEKKNIINYIYTYIIFRL